MFSMTRYHVLLNLREKTMVFWTLAFPLLLGIFFYFGLGGVDEASKFGEIPVAVLTESGTGNGGAEDNSGNDGEDAAGTSAAEIDRAEIFDEFLDGISGELIAPIYGLSEVKAEQKLENAEILGIFDNRGGEPKLILGKSGIEESILKALMDGFDRQIGILEDVQADIETELEEKNAAAESSMSAARTAGQNDAAFSITGQVAAPEAAAASEKAAEAGEELQAAVERAEKKMASLTESLKGEQEEYIKEVSLGGREVSSIAPYYFALVAMACLYMCFLGETAAKRIQANISEIGKRLSVSPVHRLKVVVSNGISAYVIALVNITVIMLFLTKVTRRIDISAHPVYAALTCMMGCLIGVTFGILIESIGKWTQNIKTAVLIGASIFCAFLAGLMISSMKDIIEKHAPVINRINPAALIADSFYCICVYDDMKRLTLNLCLMGIMSILFLLAAWTMTRRVRYDSL